MDYFNRWKLTRKDRVVKVLDGLRLGSAIIVLFHHIGTVDEDLWDPNYLNERRRSAGYDLRMLAKGVDSNDGIFNYFIGVGPGHIAVEVFLILAGFVSAHEVWRRIDLLSEKGEKINETNVGTALFKRYQKSLLKRFWRLGLPLIIVQIVYYFLWKERLAYGPYLGFPNPEQIDNSFNVGTRFVFASALNGALWILETLFYAPFITLGITLPVQNLTTKSRFVWYFLVWIYFSGNFVNPGTVSFNVSVHIGIVIADIYNHTEFSNMSNLGRGLRLLFASLMLFFTWLPEPLYAQRYPMIITGTSAVYICLWAPKTVQCLLDNYVVVYCSRFSYQIYIWHLLVLSVFGVNVQPHASKPVLFITAYLACFVVAIIAYYIIEIPSGYFSDRFANWMLQQKASSLDSQQKDKRSSTSTILRNESITEQV